MPIEMIQHMGGASADLLINSGFDTGVLRPWLGPDRRTSYVTRLINGRPRNLITNAPASLSYDSWKQFDTVVLKTLHFRLRAFADLRRAGLVYNLPNGMAHTILQWQTQGDIGRATVSMDPTRRSEGDRPTTDVGMLPLPLIHKDFDFSAREILASRQGNMPLDTTTAELATIQIAEEVERMTVGTSDSPGIQFGGATIYGFITFPNRVYKTDLTIPTGSNGTAIINDVLTLRQALINTRHFGPYRLYVNSQWSEFLDTDYSAVKVSGTLRQRILDIADIQEIQTLDFLPNNYWHMVLVEMNAMNVRAVVGMEAQTVQWESDGGMMKHFKVMCMLIPQLRADTLGNSGIAHGRAATP